ESLLLSATLEQEINETFSFTASIRHQDSESVYQYHQPIGYSVAAPYFFFLPVDFSNPFGPTLGDLGFPLLQQPGDVYQLGYKADKTLDILGVNAILKAEGKFAGLDHTAQLGIDYFDVDSEDDRPSDPVLESLFGRVSGYFFTFTSTNLLNPVANASPTVPSTTEFRDASAEQIGFFFSDVIRHDNLIASFNLRYDQFDEEFMPMHPTLGDSLASEDEHDDFTFDAGFLYEFENGVSPYYSYAESFTPNGQDQSGNPIDPNEGSQHEIGIKFVSENGNTMLNAALFSIDEENRVLENSVPATTIDAEYEGFELSARHRINDFMLSASYSIVDTEQKGEFATVEYVPYVPDQLANLWLNYVPSSGSLEGFNAGFGSRYIGSAYSESNASETASYTLFDFMLSYGVGVFDLQLNVNNLTDKDYTVAISDGGILGGSSYDGPGRFTSVSAAFRF
ncbi:MAG: TonB-dependent receptor, partial [Verrucomicrobiota bacterium]